MSTSATIWTTRLRETKSIAKDMVEIQLEKPSGFSYIAGQFIQFLIPDKDKGNIARRAYSLSSHPNLPYLEICIKLLPGGLASTYFQQATRITDIQFVGPQGRFICSTSNTPHTFIATGAGLGPIMGILTDELINKKNQSPITLCFGIRNEEDIFWIDRISYLTKKFPNFTATVTLSQGSLAWNGSRGRVTDHISAHPTPGQYFLCGSPDMVKDVRECLLARGVDTNAIHFEIF